MPLGRKLLWAAVVPALAAVFFSLTDTWLQRKSYVFATADIEGIARLSLLAGTSPEVRMANMTAELKLRYPGMIHEEDWVFMRAG